MCDNMQEVPVESSSTITIDSTDSTVTTVEEVTTNEVTKIVIPKKVDTNISKQIKLRPPTLKDNPKIKKTSDRKKLTTISKEKQLKIKDVLNDNIKNKKVEKPMKITKPISIDKECSDREISKSAGLSDNCGRDYSGIDNPSTAPDLAVNLISLSK